MKKPDLSALRARLEKPAAALGTLFFGRYLIFLVMIAAALATQHVLLAIGNLDLLAYYSVDPFRFGYLPQMLFGAFGLGVEDIGYVMVLFKALYCLALLLFSIVAAKWICTDESPRARALRFVNLAVLCGVFYFLCRNDTFNMNAMLAAVMLTCTAFCLIRGKALPLAPVCMALAQLFDLRTVLLLPLMLLLPWLLRRLPENRRRAALGCAIAGAVLIAALFTGMQLLSGQHDFKELAAYMERGIPLFGEILEGEENSLFSEFYCSFGTYTALRYLLSGGAGKVSSITDFFYRNTKELHTVYFVLIGFAAAVTGICRRKRDSYRKSAVLPAVLLTLYLVLVRMITGHTEFLLYCIPIPFCLLCLYPELRRDLPETKSLRTALGVTVLTAVLFAAASLLITMLGPSCRTAVSLPITQLYICYQDFGFIQRGLIGSGVRALLGYSIPEDSFYAWIPPLYLLFGAALAAMICLLARRAEPGRERRVIMLLLIGFFLCPAFNNHFYANALRLDLFFDVMGMLCIVLAVRNRHSVLIAPLLCAAALMTHQVFALLFFPSVISVLAARAVLYPEKHAVRNWAALILTGAAVCGLFYYFTFIQQAPDMTADQAIQYFNDRSGGFFTPHNTMIQSALVSNNAGQRIRDMHEFINRTQVVNLVKVLITTLPLAVMYVTVFRHSIAQQDSRFKKFVGFCAGAVVLLVGVVFYTDCDYGRWCAHYLFMLITGILAMTLMQPAGDRWYQKLPEKKLLILCGLTAFTLAIQPYYDFGLNQFW